jgi:hypothetical protein
VSADGAISISNLIDGQCIGYAPPGTLDQPVCIQMLNKRYARVTDHSIAYFVLFFSFLFVFVCFVIFLL